ncbi:MAG: Asp23/Gls24 family envelope stress response protein [Oscillospiraceae bacterium]|nr:Asp23/Gls24 family envelope stress response protein [Oscillospiraceae bacterium]
MIGQVTNSLGSIEYEEDVIASIVGLCTMECYGVVGMAAKNAHDGLWELMKFENLKKGVIVKNINNMLQVNLFIIIEHGTKIPIVANNIIQKVKYTIEFYTDLKVSTITVNVQGLRV